MRITCHIQNLFHIAFQSPVAVTMHIGPFKEISRRDTRRKVLRRDETIIYAIPFALARVVQETE